jgi:hypothetical protein
MAKRSMVLRLTNINHVGPEGVILEDINQWKSPGGGGLQFKRECGINCLMACTSTMLPRSYE